MAMMAITTSTSIKVKAWPVPLLRLQAWSADLQFLR